MPVGDAREKVSRIPRAGLLVLLRHGQTRANRHDCFAGRIDEPLTEVGRDQARAAAAILRRSGIKPDIVFTSPLVRASETAGAIADEMGLPVPVADARLQERHYGALQGRSRPDVIDEFGDVTVQGWRRSWTGRPPDLPGERHAESLSDVHERVAGFYESQIAPRIATHRILVVGHGNVIRALLCPATDMTPARAAEQEIPLATPLCIDQRAVTVLASGSGGRSASSDW